MQRVGETVRKAVVVLDSQYTVRTTKPWHEMCKGD